MPNSYRKPGCDSSAHGTDARPSSRRRPSAAAGLTLDELDEFAAGNERFGDVLWTASSRAMQVADPEYGDALAKITAAACDDAKIDSA